LIKRNLSELDVYLNKKKDELYGDWIEKNSSYESYICDILEFDLDESRYWDAIRLGFYIEFKKGKSIWLDLVRYSEIVSKKNSDSTKETITLFFIPNSNRNAINEIICVETSAIINKLNLDKSSSESAIKLSGDLPRPGNFQARLTVNDVRALASFIV